MKTLGLGCGLLILVLCSLSAPVVALPTDYVVTPAYGSTGTPAPDINPISFWDLSLQQMVVVIVLVFFPALVVPLELLLALKMFFYLGFRRIARNNILDSSTRNAVYECIKSGPGIRHADLVKHTGLSRGSVSYHLAMLETTGKITSLRMHGDISYFENSGKYSQMEQKVLKYLREDTERQILATLYTTPSVSRIDLEHLFGLSGPTITWHMKRLAEDGLISVRRDGRFASYSLDTSIHDYVGKYLSVPAYAAGSLEAYPVSQAAPV